MENRPEISTRTLARFLFVKGAQCLSNTKCGLSITQVHCTSGLVKINPQSEIDTKLSFLSTDGVLSGPSSGSKDMLPGRPHEGPSCANTEGHPSMIHSTGISLEGDSHFQSQKTLLSLNHLPLESIRHALTRRFDTSCDPAARRHLL